VAQQQAWQYLHGQQLDRVLEAVPIRLEHRRPEAAE
jgi:hypothetical protein